MSSGSPQSQNKTKTKTRKRKERNTATVARLHEVMKVQVQSSQVVWSVCIGCVK